MADTISLGGREFAVRPFTLRENIKAYPLAQRLSTNGLLDRWVEAKGLLVVEDAEMGEMVDLAFIVCHAGDDDLTREAFEDLPVTPPELLEAFLEARYLTGAWVRPTPGAEPAGEDKGEPAPRPTSTSGKSSRGSRGTSAKARTTGGTAAR